jgi:hypothetical protein
MDIHEPGPFDDPRTEEMSAAMREQGVEPYQSVQADYFSFDENLSITLPDGVSVIEHKVLNEGQRRRYLNKVNRDVKFHKGTGDAIMRLAPGEEKKALLEVAITGWNLQSAGEPVRFSPQSLNRFLESAPPKIIDIIEREVRKANPWLLQEATVEDIDEEIANLQEMRQKLLEEQEGKVALSA